MAGASYLRSEGARSTGKAVEMPAVSVAPKAMFAAIRPIPPKGPPIAVLRWAKSEHVLVEAFSPRDTPLWMPSKKKEDRRTAVTDSIDFCCGYQSDLRWWTARTWLKRKEGFGK